MHYLHEGSRSGRTTRSCLDTKKAFDSVDQGYIVKTLGKYGFCPNFIRFFCTFYNGLTANLPFNLIIHPLIKPQVANQQQQQKKRLIAKWVNTRSSNRSNLVDKSSWCDYVPLVSAKIWIFFILKVRLKDF